MTNTYTFENKEKTHKLIPAVKQHQNQPLMRDRLSRGKPIAIGRLQPMVGLLLSLLDDSDIPPGTVATFDHVSDWTRLAAAPSVEEYSDLSNGATGRRSSFNPPWTTAIVDVAPKSRLMCRLAIMTSRFSDGTVSNRGEPTNLQNDATMQAKVEYTQFQGVDERK